MRSPKTLILTVHHGASHQRVAWALRKALLEIEPQLTVEIINALDYCARWFRLYYDSYAVPLKHWPALWGMIENAQHHRRATGPSWLYRRGGKLLFRFIQSFDPDILVATEVGMCELSSILKRESRARFHLVGVTTGLDVDRAWAQPEVDLYIVSLGDLVERLVAAGVPGERILPCGQPLDPAFGPQLERSAARRSLQVDPDIPLLLILFGGTGHGKPRRVLRELQKLSQPAQLVLIAGRNRKLEEELRKLCEGVPRSRVLGWVENMHEWMAAADLLISKPGATTVIEALNSGLPSLAFDPLPGNELRACEWIEKQEVGYWARSPEDLVPLVARLLDSQEALARLRTHALALARPHAARQAAEAILRLAQA